MSQQRFDLVKEVVLQKACTVVRMAERSKAPDSRRSSLPGYKRDILVSEWRRGFESHFWQYFFTAGAIINIQRWLLDTLIHSQKSTQNYLKLLSTMSFWYVNCAIPDFDVQFQQDLCSLYCLFTLCLYRAIISGFKKVNSFITKKNLK